MPLRPEARSSRNTRRPFAYSGWIPLLDLDEQAATECAESPADPRGDLQTTCVPASELPARTEPTFRRAARQVRRRDPSRVRECRLVSARPRLPDGWHVCLKCSRIGPRWLAPALSPLSSTIARMHSFRRRISPVTPPLPRSRQGETPMRCNWNTVRVRFYPPPLHVLPCSPDSLASR